MLNVIQHRRLDWQSHALDYRINAVITKESFPIPRYDFCLRRYWTVQTRMFASHAFQFYLLYNENVSQSHIIHWKSHVSTVLYFRCHEDARIDSQFTFEVERKGNAKNNYTHCISQTPWSSGTHEMIIRILKHNIHKNMFSIGIITNLNPNIQQGTKWLFDSKDCGHSHQF